ncbi:unnamed protein product [Cylicocyclus nassatus]|uniref:aralkylamine N-acetyltransferase n=1 Tax=Cylicocyclus nassatus TaxID=53992 RepID=A0AA36GX63_CYLNA|nr:unnamed protein product [Cylicocyclus nassatus]
MLDNFRFLSVTEDRADEILQFLLNQFGPNEPITKSIRATKDDVIDFYRDLTKSACKFDKYSTLVYDENRLVGICLCSLCLPGSADASSSTKIKENHDYTEEISNGSYKQHKGNQITVLVHILEEELKRLLSKSKFMELDILCIHKDYAGRGLGKELTRRATEMARAEGCEYLAAVATAGASQAIFKKYGWKTLVEIPYTDYCENGNPVFQNLHDGHQSAKAMALKLNL